MTGRIDSINHATSLDPGTEWNVMIAYEDRRSRDRAMALLNLLEQRFANELTFSCTWWKFRYLADPDISMVARHYAIAADIMIFSSGAPGLFSLPVMNWIESWAAGRTKNSGVLVPLIGSPNIPPQLYSTKHFYLRSVADRARLDYLPQSVLLADQPTRPRQPREVTPD